MSLSREPLIHFVLAGCLLFAAFALFGPEDTSSDSETIVVDRRALLTYLQYQANAFEPDAFDAALDAMSEQQIDEIVDAYVQEEILFREAAVLGLDQSDNVIRQRMVQKMNFLLADMTATSELPDRDALAAYFADNIESYAIQPWVTFTHVFFDAGQRGADAALAAATEAVANLNADAAAFGDAPGHGDSFPYLRNYVERTVEYVASHFGYGFAETLLSLEPSTTWQGPIESAFGYHVVLVTQSEPRSYPSLDQVADEVARDLAGEISDRTLADIIRRIGERYRVEIRCC